MPIEKLKSLVEAEPFMPFSIVKPNGQELQVPHPDFISFSPVDKRTVVIHLTNGGLEVLNLGMIVSVRLENAAA